MENKNKLVKIYEDLCELIGNAENIPTQYDDWDGVHNTMVEWIDIDDIGIIARRLEDLLNDWEVQQ